MGTRVVLSAMVGSLLVAIGPLAAVEPDSVLSYAEWRTAVVERGLDPDDVVYPFAVTDEMVRWTEEVLESVDRSDPTIGLASIQRAIFDEAGDGFSYDGEQTLTAEQAFSERRGNCLSFTSLLIALSRSAGIPTVLMETRREPKVDRDDELVVISRHVVAAYRAPGQIVAYDFSQRSESIPTGGTIIDDLHASAMLHANLGGEALRIGSVEDARRHLEIAAALAPDWPVGWINLGVTLGRLGDVDGAFSAYRRALVIDPGNASALNNLSYLYTSLGRDEEARVALLAAAERTANPFTLIALADAELESGDRRTAKRYLKRARWASPSEPAVYSALARFAERNGKPHRAERYRQKADRLFEKEGAGG
jgi:tetratricopeptide (TPR) repeat protein